MPAPAHAGERELTTAELPSDFGQRLEASLGAADRERHRRQLLARAGLVLPVVLLTGPLVAWRLMLVSPNGPHVVVDALAWVAFVLDVGVHVDSALLAYTHLQLVPSVVGVALVLLFIVRLVWNPRTDE